MLWAKRGALAWVSLVVTAAGIVVCGDIFTGIRILLTRSVLVPGPGFASRVTTVILTRSAPLILLVMVVFYLLALTRQSLFKEPSEVDLNDRHGESPLDRSQGIALSRTSPLARIEG
jgi:hypothetical protein